MASITFTSFFGVLPKLNITYITVPKNVVEEVGGIGTRLLCSINGNEKFQCGMVALGGGRAYISVNKKRQKKWKLDPDTEMEVSLELDDSKYGLEMPEELHALLEQEPEGARRFEQLTPGQQRYIIYYVSQVRSSQLKVDRAIMLINNLKAMDMSHFDFRFLLGLPPRDE